MNTGKISPILIGTGMSKNFLIPKYANRHGLITGATGTGKTITLQSLSEGFSRIGVPVFLSDVKGDLSGISKPIIPNDKIISRVNKIGVENYSPESYPTIFWDLSGNYGHSLRANISDMGPLLLANLFELNDVQSGIMNIIFRYADENGLLLIDLKDMKELLKIVNKNKKEISEEYGYVSTASLATIQRRLLILEDCGGEDFFGEPELLLTDLMKTDQNGKGYINILRADNLIQNPQIYSTFLFWLMSKLFSELPEVGDNDKPKLVFFFDEAHLLFDNASQSLLKKIEQVVRLIRSKGVGIFFVTQNCTDIPDNVLGQLSNRVQHSLRAFTPKDQKAVRVSAQTFRSNGSFNVEDAITQLSVGEALVSTLQENGTPSVVDRCLIVPPTSKIGPITFEEIIEIRNNSPIGSRYDVKIDRESAFEMLSKIE